MKLQHTLAFLSLPCLFAIAPSLHAQNSLLAAPADPAISSSSIPSDAEPAPAAVVSTHLHARPVPLRRVRPFSDVAVALKLGSGGIGFDVATPVTSWLNLRGSGQFFDYTTNVHADGLQGRGDISLQNGALSLDFFPFRNAFRISPGVTLHNDNHVHASFVAPAGASFTLGDAKYTSSMADPIVGDARLQFGGMVAPRLTAGFGNMLPRSGRHFSVPFEAGFEYVTPPTVQLAVGGSGCDNAGHCAPITSGLGPLNIGAETRKLENTLSPLRLFPIVSVGVSYRFGSAGRVR